MPRSVLITTCILVFIAGVTGFWLGQRAQSADIAGVVNAIAQEHVRARGGTVTDCLGWVAQDEGGLRVRCGDVVYHLDQRGRVVQVRETDI